MFSILFSGNIVLADCNTQEQINIQNKNYNNEIARIKNGDFDLTKSEEAQIGLIRDKYEKADKAKADLEEYKKIQDSIKGIDAEADTTGYVNGYILKDTPFYVGHSFDYPDLHSQTVKNFALFKQDLEEKISNAQSIINLATGNMDDEIQNLKDSFIPYQIAQVPLPNTTLCDTKTTIKSVPVVVQQKVVPTKQPQYKFYIKPSEIKDIRITVPADTTAQNTINILNDIKPKHNWFVSLILKIKNWL